MPTAKVKLALTKGSLILIRSFDSKKGFTPKDKFLVVVGQHDPSTVLAFLITSQREYLRTNLARELVTIPISSNRYLSKESFVQCFHDVERLDINELEAGAQKGVVIHRGDLAKFLKKIRDVVEDSEILSRVDIDDVLRAIDAP